jgi:hypothetical protein
MGRTGMHTSIWLLVGKPQGKISQGRISLTWEDNIKTVLREIGWGVIDWIKLAEDRDQRRDPVNTEIKLWVLQNIRKFASS